MAACIGKGEGEAMLKLADRAETDVRCAIYMHAFQRMDARGGAFPAARVAVRGLAFSFVFCTLL